jgi:hypothetical protein
MKEHYNFQDFYQVLEFILIQEARAEVANATVTYLPIGLHIAVAPLVKDLA